MSLEARAAVNRPVILGNERDLRRRAALRADRVVHFAFAAIARALALATAVFAADRFVLEALFGIEFLLTDGEDEFRATVLANQRFVLIHVFFSLVSIDGIDSYPADLVFAPTPADRELRS